MCWCAWWCEIVQQLLVASMYDHATNIVLLELERKMQMVGGHNDHVVPYVLTPEGTSSKPSNLSAFAKNTATRYSLLQDVFTAYRYCTSYGKLPVYSTWEPVKLMMVRVPYNLVPASCGHFAWNNILI